MIRIRASSLGQIMTDPKNKGEVLSVGAKTFLRQIAKEYVYGYHVPVDAKYLEKGRIVEDESIRLYNNRFFTNYRKNTERRENDWLTGECDIYVPGKKIVDIKSAWSLDTFPAFREEAHDRNYEWQGRAYMMLWDVDEFELAWCLVTTPDELIRYEPVELHYVDHLDPALRITTVPYRRDAALEDKIKTRVDAAQQYLHTLVAQLTDEHAP